MQWTSDRSTAKTLAKPCIWPRRRLVNRNPPFLIEEEGRHGREASGIVAGFSRLNQFSPIPHHLILLAIEGAYNGVGRCHMWCIGHDRRSILSRRGGDRDSTARIGAW